MNESDMKFIDTILNKNMYDITEEEAERIHQIHKKIDLSKLSDEEIEKRNRHLYMIGMSIYNKNK